jgi:flagellar hook-associated protein 2
VSSPITFSGFNSIDFNQVLEAVMIQERSPLTRLENQKKTLESQNTAFSTLAGKLATLETAIENLGKADSLALLTATSSNAGVGVSATGGTVTGTYDIVVTELARAQVTSSSSTYGALTDQVATGGSLTLTPGGGGAAVTINLSGPTTLSGLAAAINANEDSPAAASVVQTAPGVYKLVLTGKESGANNAFTITNGLTGGLGAAFTDFDNDGVSGDSPEDNTQSAINAALTVNGLAVTSASNTVSDVIPGATLSLTKKDPDTVVTVKVNRDTTAAKDLVKKFITAYNDLTTFAKDQNTAAIAGKASIGRDPLLRGMRDALRNAVNGDYDDGGAYTRLAAIGIGFDMTGKMTLDEKLFEKAAAKPTDLQQLMSGADGTSGAFGAMTKLVEEYTQTGGLLGSIRERNDEQIRGLSRRIDSTTAQLEIRRRALQQEYIAADLAMTRLKSQSSALSSIGGQYRLF